MVVVAHPVDTSESSASVVQNDELLGAMLDAHRQSAFNLAYRLVRRPEDAADVVQDAFVLAVRATRSDTAAPRDASRFRPWLLKIVANVALGQLRRKRSDAATSLDELTFEPSDTRGEQPLTALMRRERRGDVLNALLVLPDDQRAALTLREYQELSYDEIGELIGLERAAIAALLYRARCTFRRAYQGLLARSTPIGCPELAPLISAMLDQELDVETWRDVEQHVAACRRCRVELRQLRSARRLHATIPLLAPPAGWSWTTTLEAARSAAGVEAAGLAANAVNASPTIATGASTGVASALPGGSLVSLMTSVGGLLSGRMTGLALIVGLNLGVVVGAPTHHHQGPGSVQAAVSPPGVVEAGAPEMPPRGAVAPDHGGVGDGPQHAASSTAPASAAASASSTDQASATGPTVASARVPTPAEADGQSEVAETATAGLRDEQTTMQEPDLPSAAGASADAAPRSAARTEPAPGPAEAGQAAGATVAEQTTSIAGAAVGLVSGLPQDELPSLELPVLDPPPLDPPVAGLPPIDLPPVQVPPIDLPPIDVPAIELPVAGLPPIDLPPIDVEPIELPIADVAPGDVPPIDLPVVDLPAADLPIADLPLVEGTLDRVKGLSSQEARGHAPTQHTFSTGTPPEPQPLQADADRIEVDASSGGDHQGGAPLVVVDAGAANAPNGPTSPGQSLVDAGVSVRADDGSAGSGGSNDGGSSSSSTSLNVSVDAGSSGGGNGSNSDGGSNGGTTLSVSIDSSSSGGGDSGNSDTGNSSSVSVSVSFDNSSNGGGGDTGSSGGGGGGGGGASVSVGGISVSLP